MYAPIWRPAAGGACRNVDGFAKFGQTPVAQGTLTARRTVRDSVRDCAGSREAVPAEQRPVRDPFELDDESDDPAAALESMKHNCCDEMPPEEIRAHTDEGR
jgi:hypothetical protein